MMTEAASTHFESKEKEITIARTFNAPRDVVFRAWADPKQLARWWGPRIFTTSVCDIDLRIGGAYRFVMRGPDGVEYSMHGVYRDVAPPERIVFTANLDDHPADWHALLAKSLAGRAKPDSIVLVGVVTFEEAPGATKLSIKTLFELEALCDAMLKMGMREGWTESFDRLNDLLSGVSDREIVITRLFDAPRELLFDAWLDAKNIGKWWGPRGFTTTIHNMDTRPGGEWRFIMHGPDGVDYDNRVVYREIVRPSRLVYNHGSDTAGDPGEFLATITFVDLGGKTALTLRALLGSVEQYEQKKKFGAIEGGNQTLDRLAEYVSNLKNLIS